MPDCRLHPSATAAGTCRTCRDEYCADCLVYSFGPAKPPFCVHCALVAAGAPEAPRGLHASAS